MNYDTVPFTSPPDPYPDPPEEKDYLVIGRYTAKDGKTISAKILKIPATFIYLIILTALLIWAAVATSTHPSNPDWVPDTSQYDL